MSVANIQMVECLPQLQKQQEKMKPEQQKKERKKKRHKRAETQNQVK